MVKPIIVVRAANNEYEAALKQTGTHPLLARLWANRGIATQTATNWAGLIPPNKFLHIKQAAKVLANAILADKRLLVIADYDCDGATACAVAVRALRAFGAKVDFLVPNRFDTGYGLSPAVVDLALKHHAGKPDILITVDNGIASIDGVAAAKQHNIDVIVTDHHLPGAELPDALAIINPNQPGCGFPSKHIAGVGVIFYVMLALRAHLRETGVLPERGGPRLDKLADLVALGTVADVVRLDANNRLLIQQGLIKIRQGVMQAGLAALFDVAAKNYQHATAQDLGFALGPRINAAGRMADMSLGINCLLSDDFDEAMQLAQQLDEINKQRKAKQTTMNEQAIANITVDTSKASLCVWQNDWHAGVVGLVASHLKETYWRPSIAFAPDDTDYLKGSGRSVPAVHLRDAIDLVAKRLPNAIKQFGGHAMAAGLTLHKNAFTDFSEQLDSAIKLISGRSSFEPKLEVDGSLDADFMNLEVAQILQQQVWGAGFPEPLFQDDFKVIHQELLQGKHLRLFLERNGKRFNAIWFNQSELVSENIQAIYHLACNYWGGKASVQLMIEHIN